MPLYEYVCQSCRNEVELLIHNGQQPKCPACGSEDLAKLLSVVAAPARDATSADRAERPTGPCGSTCGCFPAT